INTSDFIAYLGDLGVRLSADGERLRVSAPKGKLPTDVRAQIAERKAEILALLRRRSSSNHIAAPPIRPCARGAPAPLSFAQERLWFLEQLEPESAVYNICRASRLVGNLSSPALEASLNEIVSRHETLRTAFRLIDGTPVQVVQRAEGISIDFTDLRSVPKSEGDANIRRQIEAAALHPFDLNSGQLLRCALIRIDEQEHILILTTHHIAADAWSMGILTRELWTLYDAFSNGRPSPLEPLPVRYSEYAVWQREWLKGNVLEAQLAYWKERLKDLSMLNLPADRARKARQSFHGARVAIELPHELTTALNEMSHRFAVTPFMTLLATFQVLLYRYAGQDDVAVGSPIANRRRPEIEGLIGFFVNTLVLRTDLSGNPSFSELLIRVRDLCVAADSNQDLPFEKLVQELQPDRDQSRNPLFQVMFVLQNATRPFTGIPGLRLEPLEVATRRSPFDLSLFLREREGKYIGHIEYSTDLFEPDTIERMAAHYQTLLEAIVADSDQPIATLPILPEAERHKILVEWNDTASDYPKDKCIHQLFEEQVERTPDAIAMEFEDQQITYWELNRRANQLAHYLISLGIGLEKLVGICVARSIEMVVGLLGILKTGGGYVPLDPIYPEERLRFMLGDADIAVLLTQESFLDRTQNFTLSSQPLAVCLDRDWPVIAQQNDGNPKQAVRSDNLAYVVYTSGSTGKPKGVAIEHRSTSNLLHWAKTVYADDELRSVLASTSICFDLSVFELFAPLSWGGKVVLVENALCLRDNSPASDISLINTVPSVMSALLAGGPLPATTLTVNLAGESLRPDLVRQIYGLETVKKVYDLYGPSETTTYSTFVLRAIDHPTTIGRPVANTQIYILDSRLQPVPIGIQGEIYIGGAGVARGYLNRLELTTDRFIPNPFAEDGSIFYRTGDIAEYLPNGNIKFLGRTDNQVKIRGYRVELGEIEAILNQHPAVKASVVMALDGSPSGAKELVGYVVTAGSAPSLINDLRSYAATKLPQYMIPSAFAVLTALPTTPSGKVDQRKLLEPAEFRGFDKSPPRTELEQMIANIWRSTLQIDRISVHDNFFALGGHSLLAIQIVSKLQQALNKEIALRLLFEKPTIAGLAMTLSRTAITTRSVDLSQITNAPRDGQLPLSMNQEHLWQLNQMIPGTHLFNMPYVYQLTGELDIHALNRSLLELVRRHEALRTVFAEVAGRPVQIIREVSVPHLVPIDLRRDAPEAVFETAAGWILKERTDPFDLQSGPLLRLKLLRLTDSLSLLLIVMHHIISDHWSMNIFRDELNILYSAFSQGQLSPLTKPSFQFADYAYSERKLIN
ncbi:MAG TPA: amino acid adenylation domain-containing protein, partial [Candidatus Binatia bacterium]|nr:amino acid adenylation domain-containing protein [Candidatus Binatia bacterium]